MEGFKIVERQAKAGDSVMIESGVKMNDFLIVNLRSNGLKCDLVIRSIYSVNVVSGLSDIKAFRDVINLLIKRCEEGC